VISVNHLGFPPLLTIMLFLPAAGGLALMLLPGTKDDGSGGQPWPVKGAAIGTAMAAFGLSLFFLVKFQVGSSRIGGTLLPPRTPVVQFVEHGTWLPSLGISYFLGLDGFNVWLITLCTAVMTLAIFAACFMIKRNLKAFLMLMLLAETGMLGVFLSWNVFLFYIFWELMLIPAYFLIGMWGEKKRVYATTKFVIYTVFGSFIMLVAIFYLFVTTPGHNLDIPYLIAHPPSNGVQAWLFLAFMLALGIKAALFPFHSWAPDAYVEAPVPATVLIAAVMGKTATFAMLRIVLPIFPHASNQFSGLIEILAVIGILYGATLALVQNDVKRVLAFSSISHMNIIILGIFALNQQGMDGSILQMVNHGAIMAGLFFVVAMMYARSGTRRLDEMSGLAKAFPLLAAFGLLLFLAAMDLPGLGSFAGEFTILIGVFLRNAWFATVAALVTIVSAWYMVRWFQGIFHGPVGGHVYTDSGEPAEAGEVTTAYQYPVRTPRIGVDLRKAELVLLLPIAAVIVWLGVIPKPFTDRTAPTTSRAAALLRAQDPPARRTLTDASVSAGQACRTAQASLGRDVAANPCVDYVLRVTTKYGKPICPCDPISLNVER
jgi:NADH-quinone oxidoreductase subunit M